MDLEMARRGGGSKQLGRFHAAKSGGERDLGRIGTRCPQKGQCSDNSRVSAGKDAV